MEIGKIIYIKDYKGDEAFSVYVPEAAIEYVERGKFFAAPWIVGKGRDSEIVYVARNAIASLTELLGQALPRTRAQCSDFAGKAHPMPQATA